MQDTDIYYCCYFVMMSASISCNLIFNFVKTISCLEYIRCGVVGNSVVKTLLVY